jgi:hypothetical protein
MKNDRRGIMKMQMMRKRVTWKSVSNLFIIDIKCQNSMEKYGYLNNTRGSK